MIDRRSLLAGGAAGMMASAMPALAQVRRPFPRGFLWGAATSGYQTEGNDVAADIWLLEHVTPTIFAERSGDACDSFDHWDRDLDLAKAIGLNSYRFSLEWARIEPEPGAVSQAMLDHYRRIVEGCRARGLAPLLTYSHFAAPRWFSARGGWTSADAPKLFARFCDVATRAVAGGVSHAVTFNEPNLTRLLKTIDLPPPLLEGQRAMLAAAARASGGGKFVAANVANAEDLDRMQRVMIEAHRTAKAAIKSVRPDLPVGVSLAMFDDQAAPGGEAKRDAMRSDMYGAWVDVVHDDDFLGVQNYERAVWGPEGRLPPPPGSLRGWNGTEVYAPSLAGAVRYAHRATGRPILVTEHGVGTDDDRLRCAFIPQALSALSDAIAEGVPVRGYAHWSLIDNYEWIFGYKPRYGLASVDRTTFARTPKQSAAVLGAIARRNAV